MFSLHIFICNIGHISIDFVFYRYKSISYDLLKILLKYTLSL